MSSHNPDTKSKAFGRDLGIDEKIAGGTGPADHLSPAEELPGQKAKSHTSFHAERLLLTIYRRLGQALATRGGCVYNSTEL